MVTTALKLKDTPWKKSYMTNLDSTLKSSDSALTKNVCYSQSSGFSSSHAQMWELDRKEGWVSENDAFQLWCWRRLWESLDCEEIKPVNPKGNQPWVFIGKTDVEAEAPILWPLDSKSWLIEKDPNGGKDWSQEEKGETKDEMFGRHHWLNGHESEKTLETVKDREAWCAAVHGVAEPRMWLSDEQQMFLLISLQVSPSAAERRVLVKNRWDGEILAQLTSFL